MSHETEEYQSETKIEFLKPLDIPDAFNSIPTGNDLIDYLEKFVNHVSLSSSEELNEIRKLRQQKENFQTADTVIFNLANFGLGDALMQLPYANAIAREYEDKRIKVLVPPAIAEMKSLALSTNIKLFTTIDDAYGDISKSSKKSIIIQLLRGPAEKQESFLEETNRYCIPRNKTPEIRSKQAVDAYLISLKNSNRWIMPIDIRLGNKYTLPYADLCAQLIGKYNLHNYSELDYAFILTLKFLGARIEKRNITYPILHPEIITQLRNTYIDGFFNKQKRFAFDVVIAPDAGEYSILDSSGTYDKSVKSSSSLVLEDAFREIYNKAPKSTFILIPGKKHAEYSDDVFRRLVKYFPHAKNLPAESLDEMVGMFAASRIIVTWDSVTRWIAEALLRTQQYTKQQAKTFMPFSKMITFHNGGRIPYDEYGPREISNVVIVGDMPLDSNCTGAINNEINIPGKIIADCISTALVE